MTVLEMIPKEEARQVARTIALVHGFAVIQFSLPAFPIPLRGCFNNAVRNGRVDTPRYRLWKAETDRALARKRIPTIEGNVSVTYTVRRPDKRKRDLDNLLKALNDTLPRNHILSDDSNIIDLRIRWVTTEIFEGEVFVEITRVAA